MGLNIYKKLQRSIIFIAFITRFLQKLQRSDISIELRSNEIAFVKAPKKHHIYSIYNVFFAKAPEGVISIAYELHQKTLNNK
jgi:hypothetical protein